MPNLPERWRAPEIIQRRARELRKEMTPAERLLWQVLRSNALNGAYFRRQHPVGSFILDFYCTKAKLAVEVDGGTHLEQVAYDAERTRWLARERGIRVIRFSNDDIKQNLGAVVEAIQEALVQAESTNDR
jgi:very-short-patch-repair endonuclease